MPYKSKLTTTDILVSLRHQFLTLRAEKNLDGLRGLWDTLNRLLDIAWERHDPEVPKILVYLGDAIRDSLGGVEWKSEIPSLEDI